MGREARGFPCRQGASCATSDGKPGRGKTSSPDSLGYSRETAAASRRSGCGNAGERPPRRRVAAVLPSQAIEVSARWVRTGIDAQASRQRGNLGRCRRRGACRRRREPGESWLLPLPAAVGWRSSVSQPAGRCPSPKRWEFLLAGGRADQGVGVTPGTAFPSLHRAPSDRERRSRLIASELLCLGGGIYASLEKKIIFFQLLFPSRGKTGREASPGRFTSGMEVNRSIRSN